MTKEIYNIQRQKLMDDAQKLLDESKTAEAQAKMKEIEALDAKFEEEAKIQANLNALAGQKVAAPAAAAQSVDLSGTAKTPDVLDRYDTDEYKRAFMNYVLTGKKIPAELTNVDANTKTSDVGAAIPTTTLQKIYEKIEATGMILPRVTHTSYKGGVTVPTSSADGLLGCRGHRLRQAEEGDRLHHVCLPQAALRDLHVARGIHRDLPDV
jgi:HK97 family phage major capsid protein